MPSKYTNLSKFSPWSYLCFNSTCWFMLSIHIPCYIRLRMYWLGSGGYYILIIQIQILINNTYKRYLATPEEAWRNMCGKQALKHLQLSLCAYPNLFDLKNWERNLSRI